MNSTPCSCCSDSKPPGALFLLCSHRDDLGETLSTLIFAQRAMSVTVKARVNMVADVDAICHDLQRKLDARNDELTQMVLQRAAAEEVRG